LNQQKTAPLTRDEILSKRLADIDAAAAYARVSTKTIRRRIADGSLPAARFGPRLIRVSLNDVDGLLTTIAAGAT
jgi:excisionase family DNA binding protein